MSKMIIFELFSKEKQYSYCKYCEMMKQVAMPSCLEGGE